MTRITIRCEKCGSPRVLKDAYAEWSDQAQDWVLQNAFDFTICDDCGAEECAKEVALPEETAS